MHPSSFLNIDYHLYLFDVLNKFTMGNEIHEISRRKYMLIYAPSIDEEGEGDK